MSRLAYSAVLLALASVTGACSPYDPDLGDTPFRCEPFDMNDPEKERCPEGYDPVDLTAPPFCRCERSSGDRVDGGATADGAGSCNADSNEPNESSAGATPTAIGSGASTAAYDNISICPQSDIDVYAVNVQANTTLDVRVSFNPAVGVLGFKILNSTGAMVMPNGEGVMQGNILRAMPLLATPGTYYVQVTGVGGQNNYSIMMSATQ